MNAMGEWVEPGPLTPASSPAMTRTSEPPSGDARRATSVASSP